MHKLGISVYPERSPMETVYAYMETAAKYGFTRIFTCLLSVNEPREVIIEKFGAFMKKAHELGFVVAVDTNPQVFKHLGATPADIKVFADMGVDIIRLDMSFGAHQDIMITRNPYNIKIEFNASMDAGLALLLENGACRDQITLCHNFYPQKYTALDWDLFMNLNKKWKALNLPIAAFISSNNAPTHGPWEVFEGLPTCECHRGLPIDTQARHLLATGMIDDIIIGNAYATEEELKALSTLNFSKTMLRIEEENNLSDLEKEILYRYPNHTNRADYSSYMLRSAFPRIQYKGQSIPYRDAGVDTFTLGDVVIVNDNLAHYRGELQVILKDMPNDKTRNLVGRIKKEELSILPYIKPGHPFGFTK